MGVSPAFPFFCSAARTRLPPQEKPAKQFERFLRQAYLIVSTNGMAKRTAQKRKAVGLAAANERTPKVRQSDGLVRGELSRSATLQHSSEPTFSSCSVWR